MPRRSFALLASIFIFSASTLALAFGAISASAQEAATQTPPPYRGVTSLVAGVFVTPVPNAPFTAVAELQSTQPLPDGTTDARKSVNNIARDSQGRIYNERRVMVPESYNGEPTLISFHIYDPTTKLNTFLDPGTHLAHQSVRIETAAALAAADGKPSVVADKRPGYEEEDLGTQSMENVTVHGVKKTRTISPTANGTGKWVIVTDEYWYSDELHLNMLVKHDDPRTGQQTVTITHLNRGEPDAAQFEIPADYRVVDETPAHK